MLTAAAMNLDLMLLRSPWFELAAALGRCVTSDGERSVCVQTAVANQGVRVDRREAPTATGPSPSARRPGSSARIKQIPTRASSAAAVAPAAPPTPPAAAPSTPPAGGADGRLGSCSRGAATAVRGGDWVAWRARPAGGASRCTARPAGRGCGSARHTAPPARTPSRGSADRPESRLPDAGATGRSPRARRLSRGAVRRALPSRSTRGEACCAAGWCRGPGDRFPTDRGRRAGASRSGQESGRGRYTRRRYGDDFGLGAPRYALAELEGEGYRRRTRHRYDWRRRRWRDGRRGDGRRVRSHRLHGRCLRHRRRDGGLGGGGHDCRGHARDARNQPVGLRSNRRHQEVREHSQRESDSAPRPPTLAKCMISHDQVSAG